MAFPGLVRMMHDMQELIFVIMQYVVKHLKPAGKAAAGSGRADIQGYELCRFKMDFSNKYRCVGCSTPCNAEQQECHVPEVCMQDSPQDGTSHLEFIQRAADVPL